jgi:hypothetical protein
MPEVEAIAIGPEADCGRLGHESEWRTMPTSPDRIEVCVVCTEGWRKAFERLGDEKMADLFVCSLRADESYPLPPAALSEGETNE